MGNDFDSFPLFGFTVVMDRENFILKVIEILEYILIKKDIVSDLNMFHEKYLNLFNLHCLWHTLVIKLRNFDF